MIVRVGWYELDSSGSWVRQIAEFTDIDSARKFAAELRDRNVKGLTISIVNSES